MRCPQCGTELAPHSLRCKKCQSTGTRAIQQVVPEARDKDNLSSRSRVVAFRKEAAFRDKGDEFPVVSYIICPPLQPIRLNKEREFTIGRDESNQMVLTSCEVSRFHAVIRWQGDSYMVEDLDSANGTFVNEDYVEKHELRDDDRLSIGTHTLIYREVPKGTLPHDISEVSLKETLKIPTKQEIMGKLGRQAAKSSFGGDIQTIGLFSILQMLGIDRKSGCLKITKGRETARIYFVDGEVVHSIYGELQGREAFFETIKGKEGDFEFRAEEAPQEVTMSDRVEWLLLEGARLMDEENN